MLGFWRSTPKQDELGKGLLEAAKKGDVKGAESLLLSNADIHFKDTTKEKVRFADIYVSVLGCTALHWAAMHNRVDIITLLLHRGANIHCTDSEKKRTALYLASLLGHTASVCLLIHNKADIHCRTPGGYTPLHVASAWGRDQVVTTLLHHSADLHSKDQHEDTPLHGASWKGKPATVGLLLASKADPTIKNKSGKTPGQVFKRESDRPSIEKTLDDFKKNPSPFEARQVELMKKVIETKDKVIQRTEELLGQIKAIEADEARGTTVIRQERDEFKRQLDEVKKEREGVIANLNVRNAENEDLKGQLATQKMQQEAAIETLRTKLHEASQRETDMAKTLQTEQEAVRTLQKKLDEASRKEVDMEKSRKRQQEAAEVTLKQMQRKLDEAAQKNVDMAETVKTLHGKLHEMAKTLQAQQEAAEETLKAHQAKVDEASQMTSKALEMEMEKSKKDLQRITNTLNKLDQEVLVGFLKRIGGPTAQYLDEEADEVYDVVDLENFSDLFPYNCNDNIPFNNNSNFKEIPTSTAKPFQQLCQEKKWNTLEMLFSVNDQNPAQFPKSVQDWIDQLRTETYPARIKHNDITIKHRLAGGQYGQVYLAEWTVIRNNKSKKLSVAYKQLVRDECEVFTKEFNQWKMIPSHPNIARLYGAVWDGPPDKQQQVVGIIAELHTEGSLLGKIESYRIEISERAILQVLMGVAKGLKHLHQHNVIHRDLFARNILLNKQMVPIITDFGLARANPYKLMGQKMVPTDLAPEVYKDRTFTFESDVYTLGVLVWEMANRGGSIPSDGVLKFKGETAANKIAVRCCHPDPAQRPKLDDVIARCDEAIKTLEREVTLDEPIMDPQLLKLLQDVNIVNAERIAKTLTREGYTMKDLKLLPFPLLEKQCLDLGMGKGAIVRLADGLNIKLTRTL